MGQYKETAIKSGDLKLLKQDVLEDLLASWDSWRDMKDGASDEDRRIAEGAYKKAGLDPATAGDDYDRALKARYRYGLTLTGGYEHPLSRDEIEQAGSLILNHKFKQGGGLYSDLRAWYEEQSGILLWNIANATYSDCQAALRALIILTNAVPSSVWGGSPRVPIEAREWDADNIVAFGRIVLGQGRIDQLTGL